MPASATLAAIEAMKVIPPGTEPVFAPPDRARKEAAIQDPRLGMGVFRKAPDYVPTPKVPHQPVTRPPPAAIMDRCIAAWPDPNTANIRPYTPARNSVGSYNNRRTWGVPYKSARGMHFPPQCTPVVYDK